MEPINWSADGSEQPPFNPLDVDAAFTAIITEEYKHGEPDVDPKDVRIPARLRATFYMVEGLSQVCHNFDIEDDVIHFLGGSEEAEAAVKNPNGYMHYVVNRDGFVAALDLLTAWEDTELAVEMARGIAQWMEAHNLEHFTQWVYLSGIGFMPCHIHAEGNQVILPLPRSAMTDDVEGDAD